VGCDHPTGAERYGTAARHTDRPDGHTRPQPDPERVGAGWTVPPCLYGGLTAAVFRHRVSLASTWPVRARPGGARAITLIHRHRRSGDRRAACPTCGPARQSRGAEEELAMLAEGVDAPFPSDTADAEAQRQPGSGADAGLVRQRAAASRSAATGPPRRQVDPCDG